MPRINKTQVYIDTDLAQALEASCPGWLRTISGRVNYALDQFLQRNGGAGRVGTQAGDSHADSPANHAAEG